VVLAVLATHGRGQAVLGHLRARAERLYSVAWGWSAGLQDHFADLGFRVADVRLRGASPVAQPEIARAVGLRRGTPIFQVDLEAMRARVERVGWVEKASVIRLLPDTLVVAIKQRPLIAIWEHAGRRMVVASNGAVVNAVRRTSFPACLWWWARARTPRRRRSCRNSPRVGGFGRICAR
jgi:cell division protein FtsQ